MLNKLIGISIVSFMCAFSLTKLSAQVKEDQNKVVIIEKEVDDQGQITETKKVLVGEKAAQYLKDKEIDSKAANSQKMFKMKVVDDEGKEKTISWDGTGEMPSDMKQLFKEDGALNDSNQTTRSQKKKTVKVIRKDGESNTVEEFEYEGDALPEDVKKLLEENGVDSDEITQTIKMDNSNGKKVMMIKKEGPGLEEVMNLDWEGDELPEDVKKILEQEGIELEEIIGKDGKRSIKVTTKNEEPAPRKKAHLGVMIEKNVLGVLISQVLSESAAEDAGLRVGDVITNINDTKIIGPSELVMSIADYQPDDKITVKYIRESQRKETIVTLKERKDPFPFKTWESVMKNGQNDKK